MFVIVATGPAATPGLDRVIEPRTGEIKRFATRREARAHRDEVKECTPSKYYPLVVREESPDA